ncbi:aldose 1-epimerase family protein [Secundilactobacillus folii]|uniref:Aldose 1-epimerase family protein n=1 Tax=Secundilactobacillus folii TaxID=2678357 RepID=A0A7X2XXB1_9LACO|nr:aldose 1-epimerase family protein [Secundilactobacillus folii]MTV83298.1 aldose 1-epimerase family protein [Secundilactobacillus folii]
MQTIENENFKAEINEHGAELTHLINKKGNFDYIWNNDLWPKHAPVLFPAIGRSEKDSYFYQGKEYPMPQHGFAGDQTFDVKQNTGDQLSLELTDNAQTMTDYPFKFQFTIRFTLTTTGIKLSFEMNNKDDKTLSYSIGSHPAFNLPINGEGSFDDYQLTFEPAGLELKQFEIVKTPNPYRNGNVVKLANSNGSLIPLNHEMFEKGLVIIENDGIKRVTLSSPSTKHSVSLTLDQFRYVCLWTKEGANAPFLCIEPFQGLPDVSGHEVELLDKEGNVKLSAGESHEVGYEMTLY